MLNGTPVDGENTFPRVCAVEATMSIPLHVAQSVSELKKQEKQGVFSRAETLFLQSHLSCACAGQME